MSTEKQFEYIFNIVIIHTIYDKWPPPPPPSPQHPSHFPKIPLQINANKKSNQYVFNLNLPFTQVYILNEWRIKLETQNENRTKNTQKKPKNNSNWM